MPNSEEIIFDEDVTDILVDEESEENQNDEFEEYIANFVNTEAVIEDECVEYIGESEDVSEELDDSNYEEYDAIEEITYDESQNDNVESYNENVNFEESNDNSFEDSHEVIKNNIEEQADSSSVIESLEKSDEVITKAPVFQIKPSFFKKQDSIEEKEIVKHFNNVIVNKDYGNPKLEHIADKSAKNTFARLSLLIVLAIAIACVVILLK